MVPISKEKGMMDFVDCWHFLRDDGRLGYDLSDEIVTQGATYSIDSEPVLCKVGFHGSKDILDALEYAKGSICCRVRISGSVIYDTDKLVGKQRTVLWMLKIDRLLHEFACDVAEKCLADHNVNDNALWDAIRAKRRWLDGDLSDRELVAARDAARDAARAGARDAAWDAARAAARAAAWDAARADLECRVYAEAEQKGITGYDSK